MYITVYQQYIKVYHYVYEVYITMYMEQGGRFRALPVEVLETCMRPKSDHR